MDDDQLLEFAQDAKNSGANPRVIQYEVSFGRCIPWDDAVKAPNLNPHQIE
jgi:hypothetical protein